MRPRRADDRPKGRLGADRARVTDHKTPPLQLGSDRWCKQEATQRSWPSSPARLAVYVVDANFFPSIGSLIPTLTIIANALRVAEHLCECLGA